MNNFQSGSKESFRFPMLGVLAVFLLFFLWIYTLLWAFSGYPVFRDQHLGTAIEYSKHGIDLLRPVIVGYNATGTGTPQELPIWQALAALALRVSGGWWGAANVVSLLLFTIFLPALYFAAKWDKGREFGWLAVALIIVQPIVFHLAGSGSTDGFSLALLMGFIGTAEWLRRKRSALSFASCLIVATLLGVTKLPFLMVGGIAAALMLLWNRHHLRDWVALASVGFIAAIVFFFWNLWCDAEIGRAVFKYRPLTAKEIPHWFFGTLEMRLSPGIYVKAGWKALNSLWGSFILVGLTIYGLIRYPKSLGSALLFACLVVTMIFFNLVTTHRHYYLMFAPAVALLNASALWDMYQIFSLRVTWQKVAAAIALAGLLILSLFQGLIGIEAVTASDPFPKRVANQLAANTKKNDKILIINGGWGGEILIRAGRKGLSADNTKLLENPQTRQRLLDLGYTKLAIVSESPLVHALQVTNPGGADLKRTTWEDSISLDASHWARAFSSDELCIVDIQDF